MSTDHSAGAVEDRQAASPSDLPVTGLLEDAL